MVFGGIDDDDRKELKKEVRDLKEEGKGYNTRGDRDLAAKCFRHAAEKLEDFAENKETDDDKRRYWERKATQYRRKADDLDPEVEVNRERTGPGSAATDGGATADDAPIGHAPSNGDSMASDPPLGQLINPDTTFDDLGGLDEQQEHLEASVIKPLQHPEPFEANNIGIPPGIIAYGPSGTGKTFLGYALANHMSTAMETSVPCLQIRENNITESALGESSDNLAMVFDWARTVQPAVIIFDELDAIAPSRKEDNMNQGYRSIVNTLLTFMTEIKDEDVFCYGTTNLLGNIDSAITSSHRFDTMRVGRPDQAARADIFRHYLSKREVDMNDINCIKLAGKTEGFTGSNIEDVAEEAARTACIESIDGERDDYIVRKDDILREIARLKED